MGPCFGQEILEAVSWAERQKKPIVEVVPTCGDVRFIAHSDVCGEDVGDFDQIPDLERKLRHFFAYLHTLLEWRCKQSCSKQFRQ